MYKLLFLLLFFLFLFPRQADAYTFPPCFPWCSTPNPFMTPTPTSTPVPTSTPTSMITPTPTQIPTATASGTIYLGAYVGQKQFDLTQVTNFENLVGHRLSLVSWYQHFGDTDGTQLFQPLYMSQIRDHGAMPMITWESWDYTQGVWQWNYRLATIYQGKYDSYITKFAQDAKTWGSPFFLRFDHEMNGSWYPWDESVNYNNPGDYIKAYRHVHDIFTKVGATNAQWVWCPNVVEGQNPPINTLYPGDSYVNYLCMDGYNWGNSQSWSNWLSLKQVFQNTYPQLTAISNKPVLIGETASTESGGNKAQWIFNAYSSDIDSMPNVKGIVWFNVNKEQNWLVNSSPAALNAFQQGIQNPKYK